MYYGAVSSSIQTLVSKPFRFEVLVHTIATFTMVRAQMKTYCVAFRFVTTFSIDSVNVWPNVRYPTNTGYQPIFKRNGKEQHESVTLELEGKRTQKYVPVLD
jgi:hypothetical protein